MSERGVCQSKLTNEKSSKLWVLDSQAQPRTNPLLSMDGKLVRGTSLHASLFSGRHFYDSEH